MSEPFLGEIRILSFGFAPRGWATCDGQLLPINQNQALFSLLGTTYGGDGRVNFALPDLRGRAPVHVGSHTQGERGGAEQHTLIAADFAPQGWMFCEGQLLAIAENDTLFNLIGTTYGGDGQTTFALPDLRGRLPVHTGQGHVIGELAGTEEVTLTAAQLPVHTHPSKAPPGVAAA